MNLVELRPFPVNPVHRNCLKIQVSRITAANRHRYDDLSRRRARQTLLLPEWQVFRISASDTADLWPTLDGRSFAFPGFDGSERQRNGQCEALIGCALNPDGTAQAGSTLSHSQQAESVRVGSRVTRATTAVVYDAYYTIRLLAHDLERH
jgi:hypothetical protein